MVRFDAYSATTLEANHDQLLQLIVETASGGNLSGLMSLKLREGRGFHQFGERVSVKDATGDEIGAVQWGGRQGDRAMIEVKGEHTPKVVEALRSRYPHRCTRVDSCADFDVQGAFESLLGACTEVKRKHRIIGGKAGDWDDFPEKGRTLYLGSTQSPTRLRLYEKGLQPQYAHLSRPHWARIEAQVRPEKGAKESFATLSPMEVWGSSRWTRELAGSVLAEHVDPHPAGSTYRHSDQERALRYMCKQYGKHLVSLAADLGDWASVGLTLNEILKEQEKGKH